MAKEDFKGALTYPSDPNKVEKNKKGSTGFTTTYEQSKMEWAEMGDDKFISPGVYGKESGPHSLNGKFLGPITVEGSASQPRGVLGDPKYANIFDLTCGPTIFDTEKGGEVTEPPAEPLDTPKPNSQETTSNPKPEWKWEAIKEATVYRVSLEKVESSANGTIRTVADYGVVSYSEQTKATPLLHLKALLVAPGSITSNSEPPSIRVILAKEEANQRPSVIFSKVFKDLQG